MKSFVALFCVLSVARASSIALVPAATHYHSQDGFGQYAYGYAGGPSAKHEVKTADGITQGGYSYIDANNILQTVNYVSDPVHGFRVAATNLPQQAGAPVILAAPADAPVAVVASPIVPQKTPEVVAAKVAHFQAHAAARSGIHLLRKRRSVPVAVAYTAYSPVVSHQYQTHDNLGQYNYGYSDGLSAKAESRSIDGTTNGGYSYLDANGIVQSVNYVADSNGFRVAATNIPTGPAPAVVAAPVHIESRIIPISPAETPEVIAAKAAHFAAHAEARARLAYA